MPSIPKNKKRIKLLYLVLNLIISGMPSILGILAENDLHQPHEF